MEDELFYCICLAFVVKSILIGSEFNFGAWMRYGKKYSSWYFDRESWSDYLSRTKEN